MMKRTRGQRGLTLLEVTIAMVILAAVMLSVGRMVLFLGKQSVDTQDRAFAAQKAIQMMEELRGLISNTNSASIGVLDDYDDGAIASPVLTTRREVTTPGDAVSGNGKLKFVRRINVISVPNEPLARRVYVRVFRKSDMKALAETVSILRTISSEYASSQVFDVYIISIENVPGWWVSLSSMKPMFDNVIQDLQTRNPGLEWRAHWITRLSYGRDPYYTPYINDAVKTNTASPPSVYFYPGTMDKPSVGTFNYYVPDSFQGRVNVDGTVQNAGSYAVADQYNHAVRYPDEENLYAAAVSAANAAGETPPEMSLRMLLERMNQGTGGLQNALVVNLHGELLPLPPMRNYSDAAKAPSVWPNVRLVTHPENLQVASGGQVKLRVYPYVTNPDSWANNAVISTSTILITNRQVSAFQMSVRKVTGNGGTAYAWSAATLGTDYTVTTPTPGQTLITLYNSPLRHGLFGTNGGIPSSARLYGLEYIPCLVGAVSSFNEGQMDLAWANSIRPKNSARWVISFSTGALSDGMVTFETRIGTDTTTGTAVNQPTNVSRTYAWIGMTPPVCEQYQYIGDPRHMPYADVKNSHGYNWYFSTINSGDYQGYTKAANGWGDGSNNIDIPKYFRYYREALINSAGIFTSMTGFSFYYVGLGGEMGYDSSNGFPNGLPIVRTPWVPSSSAVANIDEITDAQDEPYARLIAKTDNSWWGINWIGELAPDSANAAWTTNGNLPVGTGNYYRAKPSALGFGFDPQKRTDKKGAATFFNGNDTATGNKVFSHEYFDTQNSDLTATGLILSQDFNFPLLTPMLTRRPFRLDDNDLDRRPPEWNDTIYSNIRTRLNAQEVYYEPTGNTATHDSSALIRIKLGTSYGNAVMNGLSPQNDFGAAQISKLCAINLVRGFMTLGAPAVTADRVPQVPLVSISSPTATDTFVNPSTMSVSWSGLWQRWDGAKYTEAYPANYTETTALTYNVKYSNNNGKNWYFVQDGAAASEGVMDAGHAIASPYVWNVSGLPEGSYIIRVEAYRNARALHYSYHQRQVYVFR